LKPVATAKRDGTWQNIDAKMLVPGDMVLLGAGSAIPAGEGGAGVLLGWRLGFCGATGWGGSQVLGIGQSFLLVRGGPQHAIWNRTDLQGVPCALR
jgi:hypothetical protein